MLELINLSKIKLPKCHKINSQHVKVLSCRTFDEMVRRQTEGTLELPTVGITVVRHKILELAGNVEAAVITMAEPFAEGLKFHKQVGSLFYYRRTVVTDNMTVITPCMQVLQKTV
jgi:hypothetical protein